MCEHCNNEHHKKLTSEEMMQLQRKLGLVPKDGSPIIIEVAPKSMSVQGPQ